MARQASFKRETALRQAMDLFWSRGFHGTSLKDIEAALDMRPGSIYAAFGSKEALFRQALDLYAESGSRALAEALAEAATPLEGLAAHVRNLGRAMENGPPSRACMLMKTVLEASDTEAGLAETAEEMLRETEAMFEAAFRAALEAGQIAEGSDPVRMASRFQAEIMGLRAYAQRRDADGRISALAEDIARRIERLAVAEVE